VGQTIPQKYLLQMLPWCEVSGQPCRASFFFYLNS